MIPKCSFLSLLDQRITQLQFSLGIVKKSASLDKPRTCYFPRRCQTQIFWSRAIHRRVRKYVKCSSDFVTAAVAQAVQNGFKVDFLFVW